MSFAFDQKEDLRLRLADLQQKLKKSEEERIKLEMTCDVLMKAFREEEKMQYKALNNIYEKFLEDCKIRRKRNDIILSSLYRVEDRARVIFAKTEKLKLLKDRYVSWLSQNELAKKEETFLPLKTSSYLSSLKKRRVSHEFIPNSAQSNAPTATDFPLHLNEKVLHLGSEKNVEEIHYSGTLYNTHKYDQHSVPRNDFVTQNSSAFEQKECQKEKILDNALNEIENYEKMLNDKERRRNIDETNMNLKSSTSVSFKNFKEVKATPISIQAEEGYTKNLRHDFSGDQYHDSKYVTDCNEEKSEKDVVVLNAEVPEKFDLDKVSSLREKGIVKHQESIDKLKIALSVDNESKKESKGTENISSKANMQTHQNFADEATNKKVIEKYKPEISEKFKDNVIVGSQQTCKGNGTSQNNMTYATISSIDGNHEKMISVLKANHEIDHQEESQKENYVFDENDPTDFFSTNDKTCPVGLDGVDYQNETYPESYYEQPVHEYNYSSIVSNVILEEDEYDFEMEKHDDGEKNIDKVSFDQAEVGEKQVQKLEMNKSSDSESNHSPFQWKQSSYLLEKDLLSKEPGGERKGEVQLGTADLKFPKQNSADERIEKIRSPKQDSEKNSGEQSTTSSLESNREKSYNNIERAVKSKAASSNLVHLLESDSESFQIEHGDVASGNDDSDFDFSFHQNVK